MNRHLFLNLMLALFASGTLSAASIKVEPAFWWSGMKNPELQLMIHGDGIANYEASINHPGVKMTNAVKMENPNYVILYLDLTGAQPGKFNISFKKNKKENFTYSYELKQRHAGSSERKGFDASDVLYLIMPDRFANGDPTNDQIKMRTEYKVDRSDPNARHGGDLAGIEKHLDYINDLGVTAIWLNPVLENDMKGGSYHGYATTDYYRVDPRFGTNEEYVKLIDNAHAKGLKVVMDMIFNHCGSDHPWMKDIPSHDWFNNLDHYVQTNHDKEAYFDPYVSEYDKQTLIDGWFVPTMPDLNQKNPYVAKYLIQNSIWWIEYSGIDGIRQDTYPYADLDMMRDWCKEVFTEYPEFNIVGEAWMNYTIGSAYWQTGSKLNFGKDTGLKTVMDFNLMEIAGRAFGAKEGGLQSIFEHMCYDYVYPDITHVLRFLENHDTDRFLNKMPETAADLYAFKQALTFLLTIPGIPQLYYGQELLMNGTKEKSDGYVRRDVPGGWPGDKVDEFTPAGRTAVQNEAWNFLQTLLKWRRGNEVISKGSMKHFMINNGVYVYERSLGTKDVLVILNGDSKELGLPLQRYSEIIKSHRTGKDILTNKVLSLDEQQIRLKPKEVLVMELN
jgi:glycosidase